MSQRNNGLKTTIDKEDFVRLPQEEQNYLIYGGVTGNEKRITALEEHNRGFFQQSKSIIGGTIGGFLFFAGKFLLGK